MYFLIMCILRGQNAEGSITVLLCPACYTLTKRILICTYKT